MVKNRQTIEHRRKVFSTQKPKGIEFFRLFFCFRFLNSVTQRTSFLHFQWPFYQFELNFEHEPSASFIIQQNDRDLNEGCLSGNETTSTHPSIQQNSHAQLIREIASVISRKKVNASRCLSQKQWIEWCQQLQKEKSCDIHIMPWQWVASSAIVSGKVQETHATQIGEGSLIGCITNTQLSALITTL